MGEGFQFRRFLASAFTVWLPAQAGDDATTYYDDAGDDAGDDGDDVAARVEMGEFDVFWRPAVTVWSLRRPQPTMATIARTRAMMETTTATT